MTSDTEYGPGLLAPYRVLDLTDARGLLCGKMLGDLGADVVQVEPPGGSPARKIGPFYQDEPGAERSLFWWAYCANKRGITLDINTTDGAALFRRLVGQADFVIESADPGHMASLGVGILRAAEIEPATGHGLHHCLRPRMDLTPITWRRTSWAWRWAGSCT